jgi:DNA-binding CsgD family transcriptional regulator
MADRSDHAMASPNKPSRARHGDPLTQREQEILALLTAGNSPRDIAAQLGLATATVKNHATRIYVKIGARSAGEDEALTRREHEILALLAAGDSTSDIAAQLGITPGTVKTHLTSLYKKIGAKNRVQAARYYLDHHGTPPEV